jgi:subtilisin family serine protease
MKKKRIFVVCWFAFAAVCATAYGGQFTPAAHHGVAGQYLVLLVPGAAAGPEAPGQAAASQQPRSVLPSVAKVAADLTAAHGGRTREVWEHALQGFLVELTEAQAVKLAQDPRVLAVEQNYTVQTPFSGLATECSDAATPLSNSRPLPSPTATPQSLICADPDPLTDSPPYCQDNWGLDRIDQTSVTRDQLYSFPTVSAGVGADGANVHVYLLDSGIALSNREFQDTSGNSRVSGGVDATTNPPTPLTPATTNDWISNGHGTHVAGIIGGRTFGVAKGVFLHPVDEINSSVTSPDGATFVRALDWIAANALSPAVVNWSGGNDPELTSSLCVQAAVAGVLARGIPVVEAAGNQANYPANLQGSTVGLLTDACDYTFKASNPSLIVAGGSDENDGRWTRRQPNDPTYSAYCLNASPASAEDCGSNAGACIDIWAPASHILSASKLNLPGGYCRLSGTSMAAPHVTGAIALYLQVHPTASVQEVSQFLRSQGTWGALNNNPNTPFSWIGIGSDNVLLNVQNLSVGSDLPPTATYTSACSGHSCSFNAAASTGGSTYQWDFGDGTTGSGVTTTHTFATGYNGRVNLQVTSATGKTAHFSRRFFFDGGGPTAVMTASCDGLSCSFNQSSTPATGSSIASTVWCFGDQVCDTNVATGHTYAASGTYTVSLTVTDNDLAQVTVTKVLHLTNAPPPAAENFFSLAPCRVLDTRTTTILSNNVQRVIPVTGVCGIPAGAKAVSFNVTAVGPTGPGYFQFYPGTSSVSSATTSTIDFTSSVPLLTNNAILPLGTDGTLAVNPQIAFSPGQVNLLLDVDGYFSETAGGLQFETVTPCRLADTRTSPLSPLASQETRSFQVVGGGSPSCGVPSSAMTASLNLTAVPVTSKPGYLTLFPAGTSLPNVDSLWIDNIPVIANGARPGLSSGGAVNLYNSSAAGGSVHAILDVNGYFAQPPTGSQYLRYFPITPCRAVDTRLPGQGAPSVDASQPPRTFQIEGNCGVPSIGVKAAAVNVTVVEASVAAYLTAYPANLTTPPFVSTIDFPAGSTLTVLANGAIVPLATNSANDLAIFVNAGKVDVLVDVFGYFQ